MKTEQQIKNDLEYYETRLQEHEATHSQLTQIDMLSNEGSSLRKRIAKTEGIIEALKWVLTL